MNAVIKPEHDDDTFRVGRRGFLAGFGAGALILAVGLRSGRLGAEEAAVQKWGGDAMPGGTQDSPNLFVIIAADGVVTLVNHRAEMGQGVRTSVAMILADELEADWTRVSVVQAPGEEEKYGNQNTDGSRSIRHNFEPLRRAGAAARQMLEAAAAAQWAVDVASVRADNHAVVHTASGRRLGFGDLAQAAAKLPVPARETLRLKTPTQFRYIGKGSIGLVDNHDIVTGKAQYGIDVRLPDMLYAVIARPPVYGGKLRTVDTSAAEKVPGVVKVLTLDSPAVPSMFLPLGGVAVIARNTWAAIQGRNALVIAWDAGDNGSYDSTSYRQGLEEVARAPGKEIRNHGDVYAALKTAAKRIEVEYYMPHNAHASMEPPAATVRIVDGKAEVWACVQAPQATRAIVAGVLALDESAVTVRQTLLGGGFGRKSKPDFVAEAALLSKAMDGKPVKLTWTREDDIVHDYFHTVALERIEAGVDEHGKPVAWLHRTTAPSISSLFGPDSGHQASFELGMGLTDLAFDIANLRIENPQAKAHTRIGWFRAVYNLPHCFATQSAVSELAHAAGADPRDFLLSLIGPPRQFNADGWDNANYGENPALYPIDAARLRGVIEAAAEGAGWGRELPKGHGLGIAGHRSFASYTAVVVEVAVDDAGNVTIPRVDIAIDCGPQVNPERVRSQMEGAVIQGVSLAMLGEIRFAEGRPVQSNFHDYPLTRINAAPRAIHVHAVNSQDWAAPLGGVGEPGLPPVIPALTNALFAATGKRIRTLPVGDQLRSAS